MINIHRINAQNCGDMKSSPLNYFNIEANRVCIERLCKGDHLNWDNDPILLGGGGLFFDPWISKLSELANNYPLIGWGVGLNLADNGSYPNFVKNFLLFGTRDYVAGYRWVPCASCMDVAFDKEYEIKYEIVAYEHFEESLEVPKNIPKIQNNCNFEEVISFLGSGEIVITNTYHGAYWATLLKKKVIVVPIKETNRFAYFKHKPMIVDKYNQQEPVATYDCLQECRMANLDFYSDVVDLMNWKILL